MTDSEGKSPLDVLKWLDLDKDKARVSKKHEQRLGQELGGRRQTRSGAAAWSKYDRAGDFGEVSTTDGRDITTPTFHFEHKRTEKKSMSLKREWLDKIKESATRANKDPGVIITFEKNGVLDTMEDWVLIPLDVAKRLMKNRD